MKLKIDHVIIAVTFALCVFQTFTYLQVYYSFLLTLAMFAMILMLYGIRRRGIVVIPKDSSLFFLWAMVAIIIAVGVVTGKNGLAAMVGAYFPYVIWSAIYCLVLPLMSDKAKRWFIFGFLCTFGVSVAATLNVVMTDNSAARLLAGAATEMERYAYYAKGVGGYGFIYASVFLVYGMVLFSYSQKSKLYKVLLWALIALFSAMIVFASYTTALLMLLVFLLLPFYSRSKKKYATVLFIAAVILIICLLHPILTFIYDVAKDMDLYWISNRIGQLIKAENKGSIAGLKRTQLYLMSLKSFVADPLVGGGGPLGGHSMLFDHMGEYGMFGVVFFLAVAGWFGRLRKKAEGRVGLIFFVVIFFFVINTNDTIMLTPVIMFVLPMMLSVAKKGSMDENITY